MKIEIIVLVIGILAVAGGLSYCYHNSKNVSNEICLELENTTYKMSKNTLVGYMGNQVVLCQNDVIVTAYYNCQDVCDNYDVWNDCIRKHDVCGWHRIN